MLDAELIFVLKLVKLFLRCFFIMFLILGCLFNCFLYIFAYQKNLTINIVKVVWLDFTPGKPSELFNDPSLLVSDEHLIMMS